MSTMEKLSDLGEDALIDRLTRGLKNGPAVIAGVGDDCAVIESGDPEIYRLYKVDSVVEGVHFTPELGGKFAGRKAVCRTLSDFAAMGGGTPQFALVNFAAPPEFSAARAESFYQGIRETLEIHGLSLIGGETVSLPPGSSASLSVFVTGEISRRNCRFRSGARVGDLIAVTGKLGGSLASGHHYRFSPRFEAARILAQSDAVHAMMDISDGLAKDLPRMAEASGTGYRIDFEKIPLNEGCDLHAALNDGEDYELLIAAESLPDLPDIIPLTVIGEITATVETPIEGGWDHFEKRDS